MAPRSRNRASIWFAITFISGSFGGKKFAWEVRLRYGTLPRCVYCTPAHENLLISVFCLVAISSAFSHPFASFTSARWASYSRRVTRRLARPVITVLNAFQTGPDVGSVPLGSRRSSTSPRSLIPSSWIPGANFK